MSTLTEFKEMVARYNDPAAAEEEGHVWQVWEDGEITLTKSGSLLGQRTLHLMKYSTGYTVPKECFPQQNKLHGFMYSGSEAICEIVRDEIRKIGVLVK